MVRERPVNHEALLSERAFPVDDGRWVVERRWDLDHPRCPMMRSPYHSQLSDAHIYVEQIVLTEQKYREIFGTLGHESLRQ